MTDDHDIIAKRIAKICSAKPAACSPPQARGKSQSRERPAREPVFRLASIYTGKNAFVRCVVNDVSDKGACLTLKTAQVLPEIVIVKFDQSGARKRVRIVWQEDNKTGVAYCDDQAGIDATCTPGAPVRAAR